MSDIKDYIAKWNISIVEAMEKINKNSICMLYIVNEEGKSVGSLSDGDIRRWILKGGDITASVDKAMYPTPKYVEETMLSDAQQIMEENALYSLAVLDNNGCIVDVVFHEGYLRAKGKTKKTTLKNTPIIIMAGGEGTRLRPYTKILPKPLIPIGDIPIIERIMNRFHEYGADQFYLTVNYKKEMIRSYFSEANLPYSIKYVEENQPLGTAGGIRLIRESFDIPVIVTNCDILIEADYQSLMEYHNDSSNDMTIVSSLKNIVIPYGVLRTNNDDQIVSMEEKPKISNFINTGMYVVNPACLNKIPEGQKYHMTQLAGQIMQDGGRVGMYPISEGAFLDMGQFEEMKRMEERLKEK